MTISATITGLEGSFGRKVYDFVFRDIIDNVWNFAKEEEKEQQWGHGGEGGGGEGAGVEERVARG